MKKRGCVLRGCISICMFIALCLATILSASASLDTLMVEKGKAAYAGQFPYKTYISGEGVVAEYRYYPSDTTITLRLYYDSQGSLLKIEMAYGSYYCLYKQDGETLKKIEGNCEFHTSFLYNSRFFDSYKNALYFKYHFLELLSSTHSKIAAPSAPAYYFTPVWLTPTFILPVEDAKLISQKQIQDYCTKNRIESCEIYYKNNPDSINNYYIAYFESSRLSSGWDDAREDVCLYGGGSGWGHLYALRNSNPSHTGLDIRSELGKPVLAIAGGTASIGKEGLDLRGNYITIDHGPGYSSSYIHLAPSGLFKGAEIKFGSYYDVKNGAIKPLENAVVSQGDIVGFVGETGNAAGLPCKHLHLTIRKNNKEKDPLKTLFGIA